MFIIIRSILRDTTTYSIGSKKHYFTRLHTFLSAIDENAVIRTPCIKLYFLEMVGGKFAGESRTREKSLLTCGFCVKEYTVM